MDNIDIDIAQLDAEQWQVHMMSRSQAQQRGLFITVEGVEGAGKSTVMHFMRDYLQTRAIPCITTREFGGTEIAEAIRHVLLDKHYEEKMSQDTEVLLAFAARAQHLAGLILPMLAQGTWVLCDRFTDSTYAYQGYGRGVPLERLRVIEEWVQRSVKPDYTLLLDIDIATGFARLRRRQNNLDRIESEAMQFFERVRAGYLALAARDSKRFCIIDAGQNENDVLVQLEQNIAVIVDKFKRRDEIGK